MNAALTPGLTSLNVCLRDATDAIGLVASSGVRFQSTVLFALHSPCYYPR